MFKKKRKILYTLFTGLACTGFLFSCSDDNFDGVIDAPEDNVSTGSPKGKFLLAFGLDLGENLTRSRATFDSDHAEDARDGDLVYGDHDENEIGTSGHFLLFFDEDDQLQMIHPLDLKYEIEMEPNEPPGQYIEKRYWTLINDVSREELPRKALVVLNGDNIYFAMESEFTVRDKEKGISGTSLDEVLTFASSNSANPAALGRDSNGRFTMTNSTYIVNDSVRVAVPLYEAMYHELTDAKDPVPPQIKLSDDEILIMKVERMVSKFTFKVTDTNATAVMDAEGKKVLRYEIEPTLKSEMATNYLVNVCTGWDQKYIEEGRDPIVTEDWAPVIQTKPWKAIISSWDMNALEPSEFVYKSLQKLNFDSYTEFYPGWNYSNYFRTLWAEDPNYDAENYPLQFREAYNRPITDYSSKYNGGGGANRNMLINYSYNAMNNRDFSRTLYLPENTYNYNKLNNESLNNIFKPGDENRPGFLDERRDLLAGTHIILPATLLVEDENGQYVAQDFYRDATGTYYTKIQDALWALIRQTNHALSSQERMRFDKFSWSPTEAQKGTYEVVYAVPNELPYKDGNKVTGHKMDYAVYYEGKPLTYETIMEMSQVACESILVPATMKDGDGKRFIKTTDLSIMNSSGDHLPIYSDYKLGADPETHVKYDNEKYYLRTTEGLDDVLSVILEWGGWVDHYKDGMMYYAAPTAIYSFPSVDAEGKPTVEKFCGVVRNAWYRFDLTQITQPGVPVDNPDQPIVPNWGGPYDNISLKVNVLDWHDVDLGSFDMSVIQ